MRSAYIIFLIALFSLGCDSDEPQIIPPPSDPLILTAHNKWRSLVGVADLEWSEDLAKKAFALLDGNICEIKNNAEGYGENTAFNFVDSNGEEMTDQWANVGFKYYIYDIDSCTFQNGNCKSYKQIIWANSTFLGCATIPCLKASTSTTMWICLYDPPGNIPGERPY